MAWLSSGRVGTALAGLLIEGGLDPGPVDGHFGPATLQAVYAVQALHGLVRDGVVGPATRSRLGVLYNPLYFHGGYAVHGAPEVPPYPASHGCVRLPMHVAEYFPSLFADGDPVAVVAG